MPAVVAPIALVPFPYRIPFDVRVEAPVPPLPTPSWFLTPISTAADPSKDVPLEAALLISTDINREVDSLTA